MAENLLLTLGFAALVFAILKGLFAFIAWFWPELDDLSRNMLDSAFDQLNEYTLFELGHGFLQRLDSRIRTLFRNLLAIPVLTVLSFTFNLVIPWVMLVALIPGQYKLTAIGNIFGSIMGQGLSGSSDFILLLALCGMVITMFSLAVTVHFIREASMATTWIASMFFVALDFLFVIAFLMISPMVFVACGAWAAGERPSLELAQYVFQRSNPYLLRAFIYAYWISSSLPTIVYFALGSNLLLLRILPRSVRSFLIRTVFLISTGDTPVIKQLSTFCSGLGALLAALLSYSNLIQV